MAGLIDRATIVGEGRFELLERVGEGGMAVVYRARQLKPIDRIVALKLVKLGMDTVELLRRFEQERQALATLSHPNIAAVYDAGSTDTDRPFFAMEFVPGENLLVHCDGRRLDSRRRIELFLNVCRAVQHAHFRGIIHRDLKPGNVLVTELDGAAVPKVIDFGIARVMDRPPDNLTLTGATTTLGTPAYMSPEQHRGAHVADTRSDVYSLGVMLCELLTGSLPFELDGAGRPVRSDVELPARPSTRVRWGGLASERSAPAPHGELDWVILRCLEPQPDRRYASVGDLVADLERYLRGEPTSASPPSRMRQAAWMFRRHKPVVMVGSAILLALLAGLAGTSYGLVREMRVARELAREKAEAEAQRSQAEKRRVEAEESQLTVAEVNQYLTGLFRQANPNFSAGWKKDLTLREALDQTAQMLANELAAQKLVRAEVCETIAQAYVALGEGEKALPLVKLAMEIREKTLGSEDPKTYAARHAYGYALGSLGKYVEAAPILEHVYANTSKVYGPDHPTTLAEMHQLGLTWMNLGRTAEAETILREALAGKRRVLGNTNRSTLVTLNTLSALLTQSKRYDEAEPLGREALETRMATLGPEHPSTLMSMVNLSAILLSRDANDEARRLIDDGYERAMRLFGRGHDTTRGFVRNRGILLIRQGQPDLAVRFVEEHGYDRSLLAAYLPAASTRPTSQPSS